MCEWPNEVEMDCVETGIWGGESRECGTCQCILRSSERLLCHLGPDNLLGSTVRCADRWVAKGIEEVCSVREEVTIEINQL